MVNFRCAKAALAVFLLCTGQSNGAEAAFSKDGKKVFLVADAKLLVLQLHSGRVSDLQFSNMVKGADSQLVAIARDGQGRLACLTKSGLWTVDPDAGTAAAVAEVPPVPPSEQKDDSGGSDTAAPNQSERAYCDVALFPPAEQTLIISHTQRSDYSPTRSWNYWLLSGKKKLSGLGILGIRRHSEMVAPVFASDGDIFYAGEGDLWHGRIDQWEESVSGSVNAYRYAPLATFETVNMSPAEMAVTNVAVSAKMLYAQVRRWGGTGYGHIVRLAKPAPIKNTKGSVSPFSLRKFYPMYVKALQSVQILGDSDLSSYLCASEDGRREFFVTRGGRDNKVRAWLATDDGSPHEIPLHSEVKL